MAVTNDNGRLVGVAIVQRPSNRKNLLQITTGDLLESPVVVMESLPQLPSSFARASSTL
ncbi:hypothetical protein HKBW3S43_01413 [Candidatus Hakubella thermalkaliphila]|uniref:Uncharacterized protein n=1 Tax=Candidatus Hakubella thermalkaliphila TaxID=2754717 RepID=A0A6V8PUP8_9ACTN|nr:hypothetical protein HKBW3S43_01413 [Candidatus Hakubella thermalkaliphila]